MWIRILVTLFVFEWPLTCRKDGLSHQDTIYCLPLFFSCKKRHPKCLVRLLFLSIRSLFSYMSNTRNSRILVFAFCRECTGQASGCGNWSGCPLGQEWCNSWTNNKSFWKIFFDCSENLCQISWFLIVNTCPISRQPVADEGYLLCVLFSSFISLFVFGNIRASTHRMFSSQEAERQQVRRRRWCASAPLWLSRLRTTRLIETVSTSQRQYNAPLSRCSRGHTCLLQMLEFDPFPMIGPGRHSPTVFIATAGGHTTEGTVVNQSCVQNLAVSWEVFREQIRLTYVVLKVTNPIVTWSYRVTGRFNFCHGLDAAERAFLLMFGPMYFSGLWRLGYRIKVCIRERSTTYYR